MKKTHINEKISHVHELGELILLKYPHCPIPSIDSMAKEFKHPVIRQRNSGNLIFSMVTMVKNIIYLKTAKRVDLKCSYHKK